ncbi:hypothetical protein PoB_007130600 [Plakobranchus ocellatus]|uniref:Secreted protein n=1 Tax=Plakobranchus ocellatus TaxID=259542 RepID=A0AAV4DLE7_9GAST|nr:hypothetical protein PoB_007130600 [Plakobranchus ocellatus]
METLLYFSGLVAAAGAWSPVYCTVRRGNFRILINFLCRSHGKPVLPPKDIAQGLISSSYGAIIDYFQAFRQNTQIFFFLFPTWSTHSSSRPTVSRSVRQEEHVFRSYAKDLYCVAPVQTL